MRADKAPSQRRMGRPRADGRPPIRRDDVLTAARDVFAETGIAGATVRAIAARLGSHTASIFHQFPTKEKMVSAVIGQIYGKELTHFDAIRALSLPPDVTLYRMIRDDALFCASGERGHRGLFLLPELRSPRYRPLMKLQERMLLHYRQVIAEGIRKRLFVTVSARSTAEAFNSLAMTGALSHDSESLGMPREIGRDIARLALRAVLRRPGRLPSIEAAALALDV
jgi:AcrR family transcriptional regulator